MQIYYSAKEIEVLFHLYPIATLKLKELTIKKEELSDIQKNVVIHYKYIIKFVDDILKTLPNDELEIIKMRYFKNYSFDDIAIQLGYRNHSSVIRKKNSIIKQISSSA